MSYFYQHLKALYLREYSSQFQDARLIAASKREWADRIIGYTKDQIDKGVEWIKSQQVNHEDGWQFLNVGRCVGAIKEANRVRAAHREFEHLALFDKSAQERAEKAGQAVLGDLKGMFS